MNQEVGTIGPDRSASSRQCRRPGNGANVQSSTRILEVPNVHLKTENVLTLSFVVETDFCADQRTRTLQEQSSPRHELLGMGQFHNSNMTSPQVIFDEESDNGLIMSGNYLPAELLIEIFLRTDNKDLLNCQLVCKRWRMIIVDYVWWKKAQITVGKTLLHDKESSWPVFYSVCKKRFDRNLIKNHSGEQEWLYWNILENGGDGWRIENPPVGVPELPLTEPLFEGKQFCFATSFYSCTMEQMIDLLAEGFTQYILDVIQPPIEISEWYSCRWDCPAKYKLEVKLLTDSKNGKVAVLDRLYYNKILNGENLNKWLQISHVFENYGPGLRKIRFCHHGQDDLYWAGHFGSKMARACVRVRIPKSLYAYNKLKDTQSSDNINNVYYSVGGHSHSDICKCYIDCNRSNCDI